MSSSGRFWGPMRVPFLILAPSCSALGIALAYRTMGAVSLWEAVLVLVASVFGHISVNAFNEIADFRSGLDFHTEPTAFSGGSGTLPAHPELERAAIAIAWGALLITAVIGSWFIYKRGPVVALIGVVGVITVLGYSSWFVRSPLLCLLSPGVGFGSVMVLGGFAALTGSVNVSAAVASLVPFFLVSNLLLLNQFPDVVADRDVGRRHYPIVLGRRRAARIYGVFHGLAYLVLVVAVQFGVLPGWSLLGLLTFPLAVVSVRTALRYPDERERLLPAMGQNVLVNVLTPLLMAVGIWIS